MKRKKLNSYRENKGEVPKKLKLIILKCLKQSSPEILIIKKLMIKSIYYNYKFYRKKVNKLIQYLK